jgi:hypothetical protein
LRANYHQVWAHLDNVEKEAFRTHHDHFELVVKSFSLTNAWVTFQSLMNTVLRSFLRVLVFFDNILIYSSSWSEHLQHLCVVLGILCANQLCGKCSKCTFATPSVAYMGHIISAACVAMNNNKVEAVATWPQPRSARTFLGLTGYNCRFIQDFETMEAPLTQLLKKDGY